MDVLKPNAFGKKNIIVGKSPCGCFTNNKQLKHLNIFGSIFGSKWASDQTWPHLSPGCWCQNVFLQHTVIRRRIKTWQSRGRFSMTAKNHPKLGERERERYIYILCMYIHIACIYVCINYIFTIYIYLYKYIHAYIHTHTYIHTYITLLYIYSYIYIHVYIYIYAWVIMCIHIFDSVYIYI